MLFLNKNNILARDTPPLARNRFTEQLMRDTIPENVFNRSSDNLSLRVLIYIRTNLKKKLITSRKSRIFDPKPVYISFFFLKPNPTRLDFCTLADIPIYIRHSYACLGK